MLESLCMFNNSCCRGRRTIMADQLAGHWYCHLTDSQQVQATGTSSQQVLATGTVISQIGNRYNPLVLSSHKCLQLGTGYWYWHLTKKFWLQLLQYLFQLSQYEMWAKFSNFTFNLDLCRKLWTRTRSWKRCRQSTSTMYRNSPTESLVRNWPHLGWSFYYYTSLIKEAQNTVFHSSQNFPALLFFKYSYSY